jgi:release factor glutamine methyltransferase
MPGSKQEVWTVASILKTTTEYLGNKGCETPRLDAEVLLSHTLGVSRVELYTGHDRPLVSGELDRYRELVRRRAAGEPAAYLVGCKEFYSLDFAIGPGVLVPRPETEFLTAAAIEEAKAKKGPVRAADIGTGSGCAAVALAVYVPNCEVVATERSGTAAEFARKNAAAHDVQGRVTVVQGELFEPLRRMGLGGKLDVVVSNPPYIAEAEFESLPASVRDYEPREALVAGEEGTEYHRRIAREAPEFLVPGGLLVRQETQWKGQDKRRQERRAADYGGITAC